MKRFLLYAFVTMFLVGGALAIIASRAIAAIDDRATQAREYKGYETWVLKYGVTAKAPIDPGYSKANKAFEEALAKRDKKAAAGLLSDNFQWVEWNGNLHTKADVLNDLDGFIKVNNPDDTMDNRTNDFYGDHERILGMHHNMRFVHLWVNGPSGWQAFIYIDMPIPKARRNDVDPTNPPKDSSAECPNPCGGIPESVFKPADEKQAQALKNWIEMKISEWHPNPEAWSSHADVYHESMTPGGDMPMLQHVSELSNARRLYGLHGAPPGQPVWKMYMWTFNKSIIQVDLEDPINDKPTTWKVRTFVNRGEAPSGPGSDWRVALSAQTRIEKNMTPEQIAAFEKPIVHPNY